MQPVHIETNKIPYVYVAVRSDITTAQKLVQSAHATQESGAEFGCPKNCHMVVFEVDGLSGLEQFCETCEHSCVPYVLFYEPDDDLGYTAACTKPITGSARTKFRKFRLFGASDLQTVH